MDFHFAGGPSRGAGRASSSGGRDPEGEGLGAGGKRGRRHGWSRPATEGEEAEFEVARPGRVCQRGARLDGAGRPVPYGQRGCGGETRGTEGRLLSTSTTKARPPAPNKCWRAIGDVISQAPRRRPLPGRGRWCRLWTPPQRGEARQALRRGAVGHGKKGESASLDVGFRQTGPAGSFQGIGRGACHQGISSASRLPMARRDWHAGVRQASLTRKTRFPPPGKAAANSRGGATFGRRYGSEDNRF